MYQIKEGAQEYPPIKRRLLLWGVRKMDGLLKTAIICAMALVMMLK